MIPLLDLKRQYAAIKSEIDAQLEKVLESGNFVLGLEVRGLEKELASFCGTEFGIGVASGTDALELALEALGIGQGDEVITSPFTFIATTEAIAGTGAKIVFADIDPETYNLDPESIKQKITKNSKAIIPVHLYGQPCEMDAIMKLAGENRLFVIEDCAQAIGAEYKNKSVGSFGNIGCFSFFPSKNLGGYGDGGMIATKSRQLSEKIRMLRVHGSRDKYFHLVKGRNSRLDEIQAAVLRVKLKYLNKWNEKRRQNADHYNKLFLESGLRDLVSVPKPREGLKHVFHLYVARVKQRDKLFNFLKSKEIFTGIHYPLPLHLQEVYKDAGYKAGNFPKAELAAREVISLPMYPELSIDEISYVVGSIAEFYDKGKKG